MQALIKTIGGHEMLEQRVRMPGGGGAKPLLATGLTEPLSLSMLDALSVHAKMSLMHQIVTYINKQIASKTGPALAPALVETYCRYFVMISVFSTQKKTRSACHRYLVTLYLEYLGVYTYASSFSCKMRKSPKLFSDGCVVLLSYKRIINQK